MYFDDRRAFDPHRKGKSREPVDEREGSLSRPGKGLEQLAQKSRRHEGHVASKEQLRCRPACLQSGQHATQRSAARNDVPPDDAHLQPERLRGLLCMGQHRPAADAQP